MKATEEKSKGLTKKFNVVIEAAEMEKNVQKRLEEFAKKAKIPGFRAGHAPMNIISQKYRTNVLGEALDEVIQKAVNEIIQTNKLRTAMSPDVKIKKFEDGKDIEFDMEVDLLPEIKLKDFSSVKLEKLMSDVADDDVMKSLEYVASTRRATQVVTEKRKAAKGDVVQIDFVGSVDGVEFQGGKGTDYDLELGSNSFIPGFEDQLIGHEKGDEVDVNVTFPKDYHAKNLAGKDALFKVTIKELKTLKETKIDDEFAKSLGEKDLDTLKKRISDRMLEDYEAASKMKLKRALLDALDKEYKFELPAKLVDAEYNGIVKQYEHAKAHNELDAYEKSKSEKDLLKEYKEIAERRVKLGLVLSEVGTTEHIQIEPDDVNKAIMAEARKYPGQEKEVFEYYLKNKQAVEALKAPVMEEKIVDFILSKANLTTKIVPVKDLYNFEEDKK